MERAGLLALLGRPCVLAIGDDEHIDEWAEDGDAPEPYDEILHYGEDNRQASHRVPDETENLFFFLNDGKVIKVKALLP